MDKYDEIASGLVEKSRSFGGGGPIAGTIARAIRAAVEEEREACAAICEDVDEGTAGPAHWAAKAIRMRGPS